MAAKTLGQAINSGLVEIKEPVITALTSTNLLQLSLISDINERITYMLSRVRTAYRWTFARTTVTTTAPITTGTVTATTDSTTITSSGDNFTNVAAGMFFRVEGEETSYEVTSVDTSSSPDTLTLSTAYIGDGGSGLSYTVLKDIYSITDTDFDELKIASYGGGQGWMAGMTGRINSDQLGVVDLQTIYAASGGDLHRDTSGKPKMMVQIEPDSSNNPQFLLWPYPGSTRLVLDIWYARKFSEASAFSTTLLGGDAPDIAYDVIYNGVRARACLFDRQDSRASYWEKKHDLSLAELIARESRSRMDDNTMKMAGRSSFSGGIQVVSQINFDTVPWAYN